MPTYEYACKSCGTHHEAVQSFTDDPLTVCPSCGGPLRKVFGSIGISFKGSGFYKNDSRTSSGPGGSKSSPAAASSESAGSGSSDGAASPAASSDGASKSGSSDGGSTSGSSTGGSSGGSPKAPAPSGSSSS